MRTRFRVLGALLALIAGPALILVVPAANAAPTWTAPTGLNGTPSTAHVYPDTRGGAILYYASSGIPWVQRLDAAGTIVGSSPAGGSYGAGTPVALAVLPDGGLVALWQNGYGVPYLAHQSAGGVWGAAVQAATATTSVAARANEVLTSGANGAGIAADSWTLSTTGELTHKAGPTTVFTGSPLFGQSWVALSASGGAVVVTQGSTSTDTADRVYQVVRSATGSWGTPAVLSGTSETAVQNVGFASAPDGRAVVAWNNQPDYRHVSAAAAVRTSGGGFGAPRSLVTLTSTSPDYGDHILPAAAAGADGSLAAGLTEEIGNGPYDGTYYTRVRVWSATSTATALGSPATVTGATPKFAISALGVRSGAAIVGTTEQAFTDGDSSYPASYHATTSTSAHIVGVGSQAHTFGSVSGLYDGQETCPTCDGTAPPAASVNSVALGTTGLAVVIGQLEPGGTLAYDTRPAPAAPPPAPKPVVTITTSKTKATAKKVTLTLKCAKAKCSGKVTLTRKAKKKTVKLASASYSIGAGKSQAVRLKLTAAGKSAFKKATKKKPVVTTAKATVSKGRAITRKVKVT